MQRPRLSLPPRTVIGVVGGRPVYNIAGGSGEGGDTGGDTAGTDGGDDGKGDGSGAADADPAVKPADPPKPKDPAKPAAKAPADDGPKEGNVDELPAWARKAITDANAEAAKHRVTAKEARDSLVQELGKTLGLVKDEKDAPADPAELTAEIQSVQAANKDLTIELAVYKGAAAHGADPKALADSRKFLTELARLDHKADGFATRVGKAIEQAVKDNPKLSAQGQAPERVSGEFSGGTGDEPPSGTRSIEDIRAERRKRRAG